VWVDLEQGVGAEQNKRRPAVVVSHDGANLAAQALGHGVVTIVPLTSKVRSPQPFHTPITHTVSGLSKDAVAQAEQVRAVDIRRIHPTPSVLPTTALDELGTALKIHLGLY